MWSKRFEGWYFKHQHGDTTVAFIPGIADSGAFVQMMSSKGSRQFDVPSLRVQNGAIYAGNCVFSGKGCKIDLPGVTGKLKYGPLTPLRSDIMGPFQFLPMECRHGIISMAHSLSGALMLDGIEQSFDGGRGYIEKDSGTSFPRSYLWLQCNDFSQPLSIVVSIAHISFAGMHFTGCICAIVYQGTEYRLATYRGVRIRAGGPQHICLTQGKLRLDIAVVPTDDGHPLRAPVCGQMSGMIRESSNATLRARLWHGGTLVFDLRSAHAMFEYVPPSS